MNFNFEDMLLESMEADLQEYAPTWNIAHATAILPNMEQQLLRIMINWLHQMPRNTEMPEGEKVLVGASLAADMGSVRWRVAGNPDKCMTKMIQFLMQNKLNQPAVNNFGRAVGGLKALAAGLWIEKLGESLDLGGFLTIDASLKMAFARSLHQNEELRTKLENAGIQQAVQWGCSMGQSGQYSSLLLDLPGENAKEKISAAAAVFPVIGAPPLPETAVNLLHTTKEDAEVRLSIWWSELGLLKAGIVLADPGTDLQLKLYIAAGINNDERIAAFESGLQMKSPTAIECSQQAKGYNVETHYDY